MGPTYGPQSLLPFEHCPFYRIVLTFNMSNNKLLYKVQVTCTVITVYKIYIQPIGWYSIFIQLLWHANIRKKRVTGGIHSSGLITVSVVARAQLWLKYTCLLFCLDHHPEHRQWQPWLLPTRWPTFILAVGNVVLEPGLWIRIHFLRIRIQQFFSMRIRI